MLKNFIETTTPLVSKAGTKEQGINTDKKISKLKFSNLFLYFLVFLLAILPRLYFLFFVSGTQNAGVGWYGDTYHHWQIAYLTKTTGLSRGFLRLWDLKGMEYFWGLLHPLIVVFLMKVSGSVDIVITRLLSIFCGSLSVLLVYLISKRYWNHKVAWGAVILAAFNPVGIFNDASGMVEPLAILMLFWGLYFWPKKPLLTGLFWVLASMARAEAWLFVLGMMGAILIFEKKKANGKMILFFSYLLLILFYMKYLVNKTGNLIYPIWWSFIGNAVGEWQADIPLRPDQQVARMIFIAIFLVSLFLIALVLKKKPRGWLVYLLGLGNFLFLGVFVGLTEYSKSYVHYFWVVRIFILPYIILGISMAVLFLDLMPKIFSVLAKLKFDWLMIVFILLCSQLSWLVIWHYYEATNLSWEKELKLGQQVGGYYKSGTVLIPEYDPQFTYALVRFGGVNGENIEGQMYDPFYYAEGDIFSDWNNQRDTIIGWLRKNNIKMLVIPRERNRYKQLIEREPELFNLLDTNSDFKLEIYHVSL